MRKHRLFIAVMLGAALAFAAVPASAATDASGNAYDAEGKPAGSFQYADGAASGTAEAETSMNVFYNADQIQATIPLEVTIIATGDPTIQGEIVGPTNYRIENRSTTSAIKVRTVQATGNGKGWNLEDMTPSGMPNVEEYGILDIDLKPTAAPDTAAVALKDASDPQSVRGEAWAIAKRADANAQPPRLDLDLTGTSKIARQLFSSLGGEIMLTENAFTITYTVGLHTPGEDVVADGSTDDSFYLKIDDDASNAHLAGYRGKVLSLGNVAEMADDIAQNGAASRYYNMFKAMAGGKLYRRSTSDAAQLDQVGADVGDASSQYTCKVRWKKSRNFGDADGSMVFPGEAQPSDYYDYDVRIIGVNHDALSAGFDEGAPYDSNRKAGLTFQFVNLLSSIHPFNSSDTNSGGWGASQLRASMNSGAIWEVVPADQQQAFKEVSKPYSSTNSGDGMQAYSSDKVFIASYCELVGALDPSSIDYAAYLNTKEGTQYAYWRNKGAISSGSQPVLIKRFKQGSEFKDWDWWQRSMSQVDGSVSFLDVNRAGNPNNAAVASYSNNSVCPCFCL